MSEYKRLTNIDIIRKTRKISEGLQLGEVQIHLADFAGPAPTINQPDVRGDFSDTEDARKIMDQSCGAEVAE